MVDLTSNFNSVHSCYCNFNIFQANSQNLFSVVQHMFKPIVDMKYDFTIFEKNVYIEALLANLTTS